MKKVILCCSTLLAAWSLTAADSKEELSAAAKKLGEQANYSWTSTVTMPEDSPFRPGPTEGKAEKDGFIYVKSSFGENTMETVKKGDKTAFTGQDGEWQTPDQAGGQGGGPGMGMMRNVQAPVDQATNIIVGVKEFKKDGDAYVGDLTEESAKSMLSMRRGGRGGPGGGGGAGPTVTDPKGSAKFWIKDGVLSKYEFKVSGKMDFNGNEMNMDRTTTVEIKNVGTTKLELPEAAKKKFETPAAPAAAK